MKKTVYRKNLQTLIPYISWEWKDTYTVLCKEIYRGLFPSKVH